MLSDGPRTQNRFRAFLELDTRALRIRCHDDYHLGQVLWAGRGFFISDFEGELACPLSERRVTHTPLTDVAGMLRSLYYAPYAALLRHHPDLLEGDSGARFEPWIRFWGGWVSVVFLKAYLRIVERTSFWPGTQAEFHVLLDAPFLKRLSMKSAMNSTAGLVG